LNTLTHIVDHHNPLEIHSCSICFKILFPQTFIEHFNQFHRKYRKNLREARRSQERSRSRSPHQSRSRSLSPESLDNKHLPQNIPQNPSIPQNPNIPNTDKQFPSESTPGEDFVKQTDLLDQDQLKNLDWLRINVKHKMTNSFYKEQRSSLLFNDLNTSLPQVYPTLKSLGFKLVDLIIPIQVLPPHIGNISKARS